MATSFRDRVANRTNRYLRRIAAKQAQQDYRGALHEAKDWLLEELVKVQRRRPHEADAVFADVTASLAKLAEQVPFYKPAKEGRSDAAS